jgi:hypothetical protein
MQQLMQQQHQAVQTVSNQSLELERNDISTNDSLDNNGEESDGKY